MNTAKHSAFQSDSVSLKFEFLSIFEVSSLCEVRNPLIAEV